MKKTQQKQGGPIPVRFTQEQERQIAALVSKTGLPKGEIIRRACAAMLPKFLTGEAAVVEVVA